MKEDAQSHFQQVERQYLDQDAAARYLGLDKARRLAEMRLKGGGPRFFRCGQKPLYRKDWLDEYAEANSVNSTSQEAARRRA